MAEALAVVGLVSALVQFIDFGTKVVSRLHELQTEVADGPKVYQDVRNRLPLMLDLVNKIQVQVVAGQFDKASQAIMLPVIEGCLSQVKLLNDLLIRAFAQVGDSSWTRGKRAFRSVMRESEMEKIDHALKTNFDLLVQAGTLNRLDNPEPRSQQMVNVMLPPQHNVVVLPQQNHAERSSSVSGQLVFMVPFQRDPKFLGRKHAIEEISQKFKNQRQIALAGLGGVG